MLSRNPVMALTSSMHSHFDDTINIRSGKLVFDCALDSQRRTICQVGREELCRDKKTLPDESRGR
jgi:hypothetical protein